jgi:3-oxoacyl-[acyl-carrier-protein] synthase-1
MAPLILIGMGAVTSVGLSALQSCAAIRAGLSAFSEVMLFPPPREPVLGARVPAREHLKSPPEQWLVSMATRAIRESIADRHLDARTTALLVALPDAHRRHAAVRGGAAAILRGIEDRLQATFHSSSMAIERGRAGAFEALFLARRLLEGEVVRACLVGGVDSLVNGADAQRLSTAGRLHDFDNPQGVIPGEGAAFLLLTGDSRTERAIVQLAGIGLDREVDTALGERYAVGQGFRRAWTAAVESAGCDEAQVSFRVSDMTGERYHAWDSILASNRFYRTPRTGLRVWYPAACTGDLGAAAGALSVVFAANAIAQGFAPGPTAMCEGSSDDGLRAGCVVAPMPGTPLPPFKAYEP